jgi:hypothetical protein
MHPLRPPKDPKKDFWVLNLMITTFKKLPIMRPKTKKIIVGNKTMK